jgi:hypothetical protein
MNIPLNLETIATGIIISAIVFLGSTILKSVRTIEKLNNILESQNPLGVLGRMTKTESELNELRDWALKQGYDRRTQG